ncbi:MAG: hypothetical protein E4G98_01850, partial [Promethearchaeota archaeon]
MIDVSDPTSPVKVGQFYDGGFANGVYISGPYVYLADGFDGLEILSPDFEISYLPDNTNNNNNSGF